MHISTSKDLVNSPFDDSFFILPLYFLEELLSSLDGGNEHEIKTDAGHNAMARARALLTEALDMDEEGRQVCLGYTKNDFMFTCLL